MDDDQSMSLDSAQSTASNESTWNLTSENYDHEDLRPFVVPAANTTILVVGDVAVDEYVFGSHSKTARDLDIPVLAQEEVVYAVSGAANVAMNLINLGSQHNVHLLGVRGNDEAGGTLHNHLHAAYVNSLCRCTYQIEADASRKTTVKVRMATRKRRGNTETRRYHLRLDREDTIDIPPHIENAIFHSFQEKLKDPTVQGVICLDYNRGCLTRSLLQKVIGASRMAGKPIVIEPKGYDSSRYRGCTVLKTSMEELMNLTSMQIKYSHDVELAAKVLLLSTNAEAILINTGEDGVMICERERSIVKFSAQQKPGTVLDVIGASNTFTAVFSLVYFGGKTNLITSAKIANIAASLVSRKYGTATIDPRELRIALTPSVKKPWLIFKGTSRKVVPSIDDLVITQLADRRWNEEDVWVNFVVGCFDGLHPGHVDFLEQAKSEKYAAKRGLLPNRGILVVGVYDDVIASCLRGQPPTVNEAMRAKVVAALDCVDFVALIHQVMADDFLDTVMPSCWILPSLVSNDVRIEAEDIMGELVDTLPFDDTMYTSWPDPLPHRDSLLAI